MSKFFILFIASILVLSSVSALGVTPGRTTLDFVPGESREIQVTIINSDGKDLYLKIFAKGELNESISIKDEFVTMNANEKEKKISFIFNSPQNLAPGLKKAEVVILESSNQLSPKSNTDIGAVLSVITQVYVYVPYPGKYLDADLKISGDENDKKFLIPVVSRGTENVDSVFAKIHIFNSSNSEVEVLSTNEVSLAKDEKREVFVDWKVDKPLGKYLAKAIVNFDGQEILLQKEFEIGSLLLELQQLFVKDFVLGGIAKFNLVVKNKWNEEIKGAYAEMNVLTEDLQEVDSLSSSLYDIPSGLQTTMVYYWDTKDISAGMYNANVLLHYAGKTTQQEVKLDVGQDKIDVIGLGYVISSEESSGGSMTTTLLVIIGFLVLLNLLWFVVLRKRTKK